MHPALRAPLTERKTSHKIVGAGLVPALFVFIQLNGRKHRKDGQGQALPLQKRKEKTGRDKPCPYSYYGFVRGFKAAAFGFKPKSPTSKAGVLSV
jgi:hypothetical protein